MREACACEDSTGSLSVTCHCRLRQRSTGHHPTAVAEAYRNTTPVIDTYHHSNTADADHSADGAAPGSYAGK